MKHAHYALRPGMSAIAAVLALTSTPLIAQNVEAPPVEPAPVIAAPTQAVEAAPAAALNIPRITVSMDDAPATAEAAPIPAAAPGAPAAKSVEAPKVPKPVVERQAAAQQVAESTASATPAAPAAEPPAPLETVTPPAAPLPQVASADPAPPPVASSAAPDATDEIMLGAGGILGALALIGGAFAFRSRSRRGRGEMVASETVIEREPLTLDTPALVQPAARYIPPQPAVETTGAALPAGFDLSRYGPHVQAAYRGPSPDNPSMSLRRRLKRARFYDQRERMAARGPVETPSRTVPQPAAPQPARQPEYVSSRRFGGGTAGLRPAYQS